jgi:HlyD family secretion protein
MRRELVIDLAECTEFRHTLQARPPALVHATTLLLLTLLSGAIGWAALVEASLVVRASGRVRSVAAPTRLFTPAGTRLDGRVMEVHFAEGSVVKHGQPLLRLQTDQLDNEIAKHQRTIAAAQEELANLKQLETLLKQQYASANSKAEAELAQAMADVEREKQRRASEQRAAQAELQVAHDRLERLRLLTGRATSNVEMIETQSQAKLAEERLEQARLPIDEGPVAVLRQARKLVDDDFAVRRAELQTRRAVKQGEADAAGSELANLLLQREQAELLCPLDGVVVSDEIKPGDVLPPGTAVVEIAPRDGYLFEAAVPSEDVGLLQVGMPVRIKFDAYDYQTYGVLSGTVRFISPDSRLVEEAPAYLVRIELHGDAVGRGEKHGDVKLGLGGVAEIVTDRESLLMIFLKKMRQTISLG